MEWYPLLPQDLVQAAYKASNGELAWPKAYALRVIEVLNAQGYAVFGIDAWLPTLPGPTPLIFDWPLGGAYKGISAMEFVERFDALEPRDTILERNQAPVFNIWAKPKGA